MAREAWNRWYFLQQLPVLLGAPKPGGGSQKQAGQRPPWAAASSGLSVEKDAWSVLKMWGLLEWSGRAWEQCCGIMNCRGGRGGGADSRWLCPGWLQQHSAWRQCP